MSIGLFFNENEDEILFGLPPGGVIPINRNADQPTRRSGGEVDFRWQIIDSLTVTTNVGYTDAEFVETGTTIPLVPEWTAAATLAWQPLDQWVVTYAENDVGERYDGNDFSNSQDQLDAYHVADARVTYERDSLRLYAGVGNIFDEVYATSAYSNRFYPMPPRNYYAGVAYRL